MASPILFAGTSWLHREEKVVLPGYDTTSLTSGFAGRLERAQFSIEALSALQPRIGRIVERFLGDGRGAHLAKDLDRKTLAGAGEIAAYVGQGE